MTEDIETVAKETREIAQENSKPGKFSFLDRLASRNYPTEEVEVFLDEAAGHKIERLKESLLNLQDHEQREVIEKQISFQSEKARESRYIIHMQGVSVEEYDAVVDEAQKEFPLEYKEGRNPLTMAAERELIPNEGREIFFRTALWAKFIRSVEDSEGNIDDDITPEFVGVVLNQSPVVAQARIQLALERLRMTTAWMDEIQGEDFLAKS